jgi:APA family basic amino acid/polyamine antiporter
MANGGALVKGLGLYGAASVAVGTMIGTGVFLVTSDMLHAVGAPLMVLGVWIFAGVLSLFGALGYAELGAALPEAGGEYVYMHRAYGPLAGFLYGWTQFLVAKSASIATIATGFLLYLAYFFPWLAAVVWQSGPAATRGAHHSGVSLTGIQIGATALIVLLSFINILGVRRSGALQTAFTAAKLAVLGILIVLGLTIGHGSFAHFRGTIGSTGSKFAAFGLATISALWAYDGWNNLNMVASEVRDPQRNIPRALILGSILVAVVYLLANVSYFYVLSPSDVAATKTVAAAAAQRFLGSAGGTFVAVGVLISTFAALNGSILSGSRIPYAQAQDGLFPKALAAVNPRFHTPAAAIAAQALIAGMFALSGEYRGLYTKTIFSEWVFYAFTTATIFVLRRREPNLPRPYRTWGYPLVPVIFVSIAALFLVNTLIQQTRDLLWCLALMTTGIPLYFGLKLRNRAR